MELLRITFESNRQVPILTNNFRHVSNPVGGPEPPGQGRYRSRPHRQLQAEREVRLHPNHEVAKSPHQLVVVVQVIGGVTVGEQQHLRERVDGDVRRDAVADGGDELGEGPGGVFREGKRSGEDVRARVGAGASGVPPVVEVPVGVGAEAGAVRGARLPPQPRLKTWRTL